MRCACLREIGAPGARAKGAVTPPRHGTLAAPPLAKGRQLCCTRRPEDSPAPGCRGSCGRHGEAIESAHEKRHHPRPQRPGRGPLRGHGQPARVPGLDDPLPHGRGLRGLARRALHQAPLRPPGHADDFHAARGDGRARGRLSRHGAALGHGRDRGRDHRLRGFGRSCADGRHRLHARAQLLRGRAQARGRRDELLRPSNRRRDRHPHPPQHPPRLLRIAGLAHLRGAGHSGDRRSGACPRPSGARRQHLGDALFLPRLRARRRRLDPRRHQIHRRPFRRDARHHRGE